MFQLLIGVSTILLENTNFLMQAKRNAYVLRRTKGIRLNKMGSLFPKKLKRQEYYYEVVENTDIKVKPPIEIVLIKDVPGVGMMGEKIKTNCYMGYRDFLLPKLGVYASSPEAKTIVRAQDNIQFSSIYSKIVKNYLSQRVLQILLSSQTKWILEHWHVTLALRRAGVVAAENCIELPQQRISGPDPEIENKDFIINITMNNSEIFLVRCRIRQVANEDAWLKLMNEESFDEETNPLFPEEKNKIDQLFKIQQQLQETSKIRKFLENSMRKK